MNEKHNAFRTLADTPLLVTSILCYIWIHSWAKWGEPELKDKWSSLMIQKSSCRHCNLISTRDL